MHLTFAPRGILQIDGARIIFRNFAGIAGKFNREGDRSFSVVIPDQEIAEKLIEDGWNVKIKPPREEGEEPFMHLPVKVSFNDRGPNCILNTNGRRVQLDADTVSCLDDVDIVSCDIDIRPYDWEVNGNTGRSAYLQGIEVIQEVDRFAARLAEEEFPCDDESPV